MRVMATAYILKKELRLPWSREDKAQGSAHLDSWISQAEASCIAQLSKMGESLQRHRESILAYFDHRIIFGLMDATNTKIHAMQRQTYGIRDQKFFKLKVKSLHERAARLVGTR